VLEAAFWGLVGGIALVIGAVFALVKAPSSRVVGLIMAFGAGVLISAVAYELVAKAFVAAARSGAVALGLAAGAVTYFVGDILIARGANMRRNSAGAAQNVAAAGASAAEGGQALALGALLDGIPESIVIGTSMLSGSGVSVAMVVAVFVSNLPEAIAATDDLVRSEVPGQRIVGMWMVLALIFAVAAALGFSVVGALPAEVQAFIQAFAAGALLTMLGNTMIPEGYERARHWAGLCLVLGFALAFGLAAVEAVL
jgi:zinc transporter, ZIP family